eukprot:Opistho-1_new@27128
MGDVEVEERKPFMSVPLAVSSQRAVPAFLQKLFSMVDDDKNSFCIGWSNKGLNFLVMNAEHFAKDVLPLYFKHNNFASFIRQLNMYGFSKVTSVRKGVVQGPLHSWEFSHQYFRKGHPDLLCHISRKTNNSGASSTTTGPTPGEPKAPRVARKAEPQPVMLRTAPAPALVKAEDHSESNADPSEMQRELEEMRHNQAEMQGLIDQLRAENRKLWQQQQETNKTQEQMIQRIVGFLARVCSDKMRNSLAAELALADSPAESSALSLLPPVNAQELQSELSAISQDAASPAENDFSDSVAQPLSDPLFEFDAVPTYDDLGMLDPLALPSPSEVGVPSDVDMCDIGNSSFEEQYQDELWKLEEFRVASGACKFEAMADDVRTYRNQQQQLMSM